MSLRLPIMKGRLRSLLVGEEACRSWRKFDQARVSEASTKRGEGSGVCLGRWSMERGGGIERTSSRFVLFLVPRPMIYHHERIFMVTVSSSLPPIVITAENPPSSLPRKPLNKALVSSLLTLRTQVEFPLLVDTILRSILSERLSWQDPMAAWTDENEVQLRQDIIHALASLGVFTSPAFLVLTEDLWRSTHLPGRFTEARRLVLESTVGPLSSAISRGFFWTQVPTKLRITDRGHVAAFPGTDRRDRMRTPV